MDLNIGEIERDRDRDRDLERDRERERDLERDRDLERECDLKTRIYNEHQQTSQDVIRLNLITSMGNVWALMFHTRRKKFFYLLLFGEVDRLRERE